MKNQLVLVLLFLASLVYAQNKPEMGMGFQLKKGFIYQINEETNAEDKYSYSTGFINPQVDFGVTFFASEKTNLYTGLSLGFSSHKCQFLYSANGNHFDETYTTQLVSLKLPLRVKYNLTNRIGVIGGAGINFSKVFSYKLVSNPYIVELEKYESSFYIPTSSGFVTGSLVGGVQFLVVDHVHLFGLLDIEFGKTAKAELSNRYQYQIGSPDITYYTRYRPQLLMLSVGVFIDLYK